MQKVKIPRFVDPIKSAAKRLDYEGIIPKDQMSRLAEVVDEVSNDIEVKVSFGVDLQGLTVIEGNVGAAVKCVCQRCGEVFDLVLQTNLSYSSDEEKINKLGLNVDYDIATVNEFGEVDLYSIIEDELILALPLVTMHDVAECPMGEVEMVVGKIEESESSNPFAVLSKLKR
ncbi:MAG: 23S rRNA accumulation protein YceD [Succinivibrionaceae bacterium]